MDHWHYQVPTSYEAGQIENLNMHNIGQHKQDLLNLCNKWLRWNREYTGHFIIIELQVRILSCCLNLDLMELYFDLTTAWRLEITSNSDCPKLQVSVSSTLFKFKQCWWDTIVNTIYYYLMATYSRWQVFDIRLPKTFLSKIENSKSISYWYTFIKSPSQASRPTGRRGDYTNS